MTLFFPDVNVWVALSVRDHVHSAAAWRWLREAQGDCRLLFSRYTQVGLLRLITSTSVAGPKAATVTEAWQMYDRWLDDPRVEFYPEPRGLDPLFRRATAPFGPQRATKAIGDCLLLATAQGLGAPLITFDRALFDIANGLEYAAILLS